MKVLITGGAGFIGSTLANRLIADSHAVAILDDLTTGQRRNVPSSAIFVKASLHPWYLHQAFDWKPDVVVHAAASYADPRDWHRDLETNAIGTADVVRKCEEIGARLIYFQTALCYGSQPYSGEPRPLQIDQPLRPDSSYAISKTAGERYISMSELDWVSFRLANVYGPRNISGPVPTFYKRLAEGLPIYLADSRRDFVYISELIEVVVQAVEGRGYGVYHFGSGKDVAISELFDAVVKAMDIKDVGMPKLQPRAPGDAETILLDPTLTRKEFAFLKPLDLETGVAAAVNYYQRNGIGETYTHLRIDK